MIGFVERWNEFLDLIPPERQDIYFREEYVRLYETACESACCFVYQDVDGTFVFPFLRREFSFRGRQLFDFETAYGYGGPVSTNCDREFMARAFSEMKRCAIGAGYVCGFVRFHPMLENWFGFDEIGRVILDRKTVAMDLSAGIDATWDSEIHSKNRNMIKKGEKNGLEFIVDNDFSYLDDFIRLYDSTMDKLGADEFYYFQHEYYDQLKKSLANRFLGVVKHEGAVVASAIFFYQLPYGHYHLAGSDRAALSLSPNNFLLWGAAKELCNRGVKRFHLGGGTDGQDDNSLFLYKRRFSKSTCQFALGKIVFDQSLYDEICAVWETANSEKAVRLKNILLKYKY